MPHKTQPQQTTAYVVTSYRRFSRSDVFLFDNEAIAATCTRKFMNECVEEVTVVFDGGKSSGKLGRRHKMYTFVNRHSHDLGWCRDEKGRYTRLCHTLEEARQYRGLHEDVRAVTLVWW